MVSGPRNTKQIKSFNKGGRGFSSHNDLRENKPSSKSGANNKNEPNNKIGTDLIFAFVIFLFASSGGWLFFSQKIFSGSFDDKFNLYFLISIAFLSFGFVSIAVYWERAQKYLTPLFPFLAFVFVVLLSSLWSVNITTSFRDALAVLVIIGAGFGASLYFKPPVLSSIIAIVLWFSLLIQFLLQVSSGTIGDAIIFDNAELGLAICINAWAWVENRDNGNKSSEIFWAISFVLLMIISGLSGYQAGYFILLSLVLVKLSVKIDDFAASRGFYIANRIALMMLILTIYWVWFSPNIIGKFLFILENLEGRALIGNGFGGLNNPLSTILINSLGIIGMIGVLLIITYLIIAIIFIPSLREGQQILSFGIFALLLTDGDNARVIGLVTICLMIAIIQNIIQIRNSFR